MEKIPLLNGLRGLAIVGVVFHHSFYPHIPHQGSSLLSLIGSSGWMGVNVFFFLSGFVLYLPYAARRRCLSDGAAVLAFYAHRAKRLLPLFYASTAFLLLFLSRSKPESAAFYTTALDLLLATFVFRPDTFFPVVNEALWSIGVEIWFSVLFPVIVLVINRFGWRRVVFYLMLLALASRFLGRLFEPGLPTSILVTDRVVGRLDDFLLGMLGAWLYARGRFTARPLAQLAAGIGLILCAMELWVWTLGNPEQQLPWLGAAFFNPVLNLGLLLAVNGLLLHGGRLREALSVWPLQMLGLMCYSVYIWHIPILARFGRQAILPALTYVAYVALVLAVSWLSYRYIEFRNTPRWRALLPARRPSSSLQARTA